MSKYLYIFIDESGNFDFFKKGTKNWILTSISTLDPLKDRTKFSELKYKLLCDGKNQDFFHATEDKQEVRDRFFRLLEKKFGDFSIDSVIAQKNKTHPSLYQKPSESKKIKFENKPDEFYRIVTQTLLRYIFTRYKNQKLDGVIVVLSSLFNPKRANLIQKTLKTYLKQFTPNPFHIYFHRSESDINSQIADYCGWAIYVKHEKNEIRPYKQIESKLKSEFEIFKRGETFYY
ncbi:DUF3800 domain-containing protein [Patescibacteria group bacterium]|nr:DUF3800 domain-containing protein [Patescibacteria group bacterium]MBU1885088.1 DUF3800 domain-containing protein [Patescibacteria group bacterium]